MPKSSLSQYILRGFIGSLLPPAVFFALGMTEQYQAIFPVPTEKGPVKSPSTRPYSGRDGTAELAGL
jgi:hypothetical protein